MRAMDRRADSAVRAAAGGLAVLAVVFGAASPAGAGRLAQPDPEPGVTEVELQTFDDEAFPPEGWRTFDNEALARRREETYTWGQADCDLPTTAGNRFAAWGTGGGRLGAELLCGAEYDQPVESWLVREGIDASSFEGGLLVSFDIRFDVPPWVERSPSDPAYVPPPVRVCGSTSTPGNFSCRRISGQPGTENRWISTGANPVPLDMTAGQADAAIAFIYTDTQPDGLFSGVMIDNVRIQGLSEDPGPTPTSGGTEPTASPPPTTPVPTLVPTPFTPRDAQTAYLPIAALDYDAQVDGPGGVPTALPGRIEVVFGTNVDGTGRVENAGSRFDYGIRRLCAKESWFDLAPGTRVSWQWYSYNAGEGRFDEIPGEQLNGGVVAQTAQGFANQCIRYVDEQSNEVPVLANRYKVAVTLRDEPYPIASGIAEVVQGGGPEPTAGPSPTPKPLPEGCSDPLINGDFEQGPGAGWVQRTPSGEPIIRTEIALESTYAALFGRHAGAQESLASTVLIDTLPADRIEKAELSFALAIVSDETLGDGEADDLFAVGVINEALTFDQAVNALSEESLPPREWRGLSADLTAAFTQRADFERVVLGFVTQQSAENVTNFIMDNVVLELCLTDGQVLRVPIGDGVQAPAGGSLRLGGQLRQRGAPGTLRSAPLDRAPLPADLGTLAR